MFVTFDQDPKDREKVINELIRLLLTYGDTIEVSSDIYGLKESEDPNNPGYSVEHNNEWRVKFTNCALTITDKNTCYLYSGKKGTNGIVDHGKYDVLFTNSNKIHFYPVYQDYKEMLTFTFSNETEEDETMTASEVIEEDDTFKPMKVKHKKPEGPLTQENIGDAVGYLNQMKSKYKSVRIHDDGSSDKKQIVSLTKNLKFLPNVNEKRTDILMTITINNGEYKFSNDILVGDRIYISKDYVAMTSKDGKSKLSFIFDPEEEEENDD